MSSEKKTRVILEKDYSAEAKAGNFDPLITFFHNGAAMIVNARSFRGKEAKSHRGVFVGAALLANNVEAKKQRIYVGWNFSPVKGVQKRCAEMRAIGISISDGYARPEAIIVPGETNPEVVRSITGLPSRILPPCEPCRESLHDDTVVMPIGGEEDIYGAYTGKLLRSEKHLLLPEGARPEKAASSFVQPPLYDLTKINWPRAEEAYRDLSAGLVGDSVYEEELRMARADLAVAVLSDPEYLLAA